MFIFYKFHIDLCLLIISLSIVTIYLQTFLASHQVEHPDCAYSGNSSYFFQKTKKGN